MLDPFYPIVDSSAWVERLTGVGAKLVQLRIKTDDQAHILREIRVAMGLCRRTGAQLIVNDHWQAAIAAGADFVHLGQEDLDEADRGAIARTGLRLGVSTHSHAELERALALDPDYVALGPVWPTILKDMPWNPQGLARVTEWKRLAGDLPLVAIGGLTPERAAACLDAGADSVAVVTDITLNPLPEDRAREWIAATAPWRRPVA